MTTYAPRFDSQRDPDDPYRNYACAAASTSMAIDRATIGGMRPGQRLVRSLTGEPIPNPDSPGLTDEQCVTASKKLHVPLTARNGEGYMGLVRAVLSGRGAIVEIKYGALPAELRSDPDYKAGHMIYVNRVRELSTGRRWYVADPLARGWRWWDGRALKAAMLAWSASGRYAVTRITPEIL